MKKIFLLLIVAIAFSQCNQKLSVVKRKYNKGFYIASSKKPENAQTKQIATVKKETKEPAVTIESTENKSTHLAIEENTQAVDLKNKAIQPSNFASSSLKSENSTSASALENNYITAQAKGKTLVEQKSNRGKLTNALLLNKLLYKGKKANDTNTLILVILSLFPVICLIAVYLKDGKSITMNFWIDLLLHITLIGAIVFALLVVLDIVNLG